MVCKSKRKEKNIASLFRSTFILSMNAANDDQISRLTTSLYLNHKLNVKYISLWLQYYSSISGNANTFFYVFFWLYSDFDQFCASSCAGSCKGTAPSGYKLYNFSRTFGGF